MMESENEEYLSKLPFSAGMIGDGNPTLVHDLRMELDKEREGHAITKAYYRQVDDAYTREAEELATMMKKSQGTSEQKAENKPTEKSKEEKTGKPRSFSPPEKKGPSKHPDPPGPPGDDPPDPDTSLVDHVGQRDGQLRINGLETRSSTVVERVQVWIVSQCWS